MSKSILITGGAGALGRALGRKLTERGIRVRVLALPGDGNTAELRRAGIDVRFGDVSLRDDLHGLCDGIDAVVHCAAVIVTSSDPSIYTSVNAGGTRNMIGEAALAGVSHFIHISSASVLYPKPTPYSISKRLAEEFVRKSPLPWTIVRPTLVYGKRGGLEFDMFLKYLKRFPAVPFIGEGEALKRPVFVDDVVDGLVKLALLDTGGCKVYNFSGATSISMADFARLCLTLLGKRKKPIVRLPVWPCIAAAEILGWIMKDPPLTWSVIAGVTQDADLDPADAVREIGYAPRGVEQALPGCFPRE